MNPKNTENAQLKKTEKENRKNILKKLQALLLVIVFAAGCTVIVYESPQRRARSVYAQHWQYCPYGGFWGHIYWECMWYYRYPYYSLVMNSHVSPSKGRKISKKQLQRPTSSGGTTTTSTKVTKRKVVKTEKEKPKKVIKKEKKKDV